MCRLLGVVNREPVSLTEAVRDELPLFTALSERHKDGWGVAWYDEDRLIVRRGIDTALASSEYGSALEQARGGIELVHLRRASEGLALTLANTHPFTEGMAAFAHNGQFDMPEGLREWVLEQGGRPAEGTTDSELFLSLITVHAREHDLPRAIQLAAADLTREIPARGGRLPEGLNCLLMTPDALVAYAQSDPEQLQPESRWDTYDLCYREDPERVIVSSTGYDQPGFRTLDQGTVLTIAQDTLQLEHRAPLADFALAPARRDGEAAWAARRPDAPGAQDSLRAA